MRASTILSLTLVSAASFAVADVVTLGNDIKKVDSQATKLSKLIKGTDGSDLDKDIDINTEAQALNTALIKGTKDSKAVKSSEVNDNLVNGIIKTLKGTEKTAKGICQTLVTYRKAFDKVGVSTFVYADVRNIAVNVDAFGKALVSLATTSTKKDAQSLADDFNADIKICTDEFKTSLKY